MIKEGTYKGIPKQYGHPTPSAFMQILAYWGLADLDMSENEGIASYMNIKTFKEKEFERRKYILGDQKVDSIFGEIDDTINSDYNGFWGGF